MKLPHIIIGLLISISLVTACNDNSTTIGSSLVTDSTEIIIDSAFTLTGHSVDNPLVQSRTLTQLLGSIDAKEYGSFKSDVVTQFMPASTIDTTGVSVNDLDSIKLLMFMSTGDFTGDSLVPMGLNVYRLNRQLPSPIYSDFDPKDYFSDKDLIGSTVYTANALYNDSLSNLNYRAIQIKLPLSMAKDLYNRYLSNPETFASPQAFAEWFPGIYISNTFGSGRIVNIYQTRMNVYFHRHTKIETDSVTRDTITNGTRAYLAVTPEVVTNNNITYAMSPRLTEMARSGKQIMVAPIGMNVEIKFPAKKIIDSFLSKGGKLSVLNTLTMSIPATEVENEYGITTPKDLLMVKSSEKETFFANSKVTDDRTSFLAVYDSKNKCYTFSNLRPYIMDMLKKEKIEESDVTFTLIPVSVATESTEGSIYQDPVTYVTAINPYVERPVMADFNIDKAKIKLTFSKQSIIF